MANIVALAALLAGMAPAPAPAACFEAHVTGYIRGHHSPRTWDGTSIYTDEPIAAASWNIPINSRVDIDGLGSYRIADRGMLGSVGWIDVAVWSREEALAITGYRTICVTPP